MTIPKTDGPSSKIAFNRAPVTGRELARIEEALLTRKLGGDGPFTHRCEALLAQWTGTGHAFLVHSCTAALEIAAMMLDLAPGDEVILPSYTFVSTANAIALRGATPVFVDIRADTLNLDETKIEAAITPRTKAIFAVHYAGVVAEMDAINAIARARELIVVEDAAQAYLSTYRGRPAGGLGDMAAFSFHETKNIVSGEGGALTTPHEAFARRTRIFCDKGTNRSEMLTGLVDKYTWVDIGSSYKPAEIVAASLLCQLEDAQELTADRLASWEIYHAAFADLETREILRRPIVPPHCGHNAHMYYLLLRDGAARNRLISDLMADGITAPFHYIPLHSSPGGLKFGRASGALGVTDDLSARLIRLPMFAGIGADAQRVIERVRHHLKA